MWRVPRKAAKPSSSRTQPDRRSERTNQVRERDDRARTTRCAGLQRPLIERRKRLPAVVGEGLVRLSHAVDVVLALPGVALLLGRIENLVREALGHRLLAASPGELDQP